jgi:putative oxidoreductase
VAKTAGPLKKLEANLTSLSPFVLSVFRIVLAFLFLCHATSHLLGFPAVRMQAPVGSWPIWWGGLIEIVAGLLVLGGLVTRFAAFIASGVMAYAYFIAHQPKTLWPINNGGELAALMCFGFFLLIFTGGGSLALDAKR